MLSKLVAMDTYALPCFWLIVSQISMLTAKLGSNREGLQALSIFFVNCQLEKEKNLG